MPESRSNYINNNDNLAFKIFIIFKLCHSKALSVLILF